MEALTTAGLPTQGVRIVSNYQPQMVSDCVKVAGTAPIPTSTVSLKDSFNYEKFHLQMIGDIFGIVEQGAVVQLATSGEALAVTACAQKMFTMVTYQPYIVQGSMSIEGIILSGLQLKQVVAQVQNTLNFVSHVRFTTPITYS